jgi:subtilisin family serine protease
MAAGVVSGVVADLLQKSPTLTPDQVKARLMKIMEVHAVFQQHDRSNHRDHLHRPI